MRSKVGPFNLSVYFSSGPTSPLRLQNFSLTFRHLVPFLSVVNHFWKCPNCVSSFLHILWITWWADCRKWDRQGTCCNPQAMARSQRWLSLRLGLILFSRQWQKGCWPLRPGRYQDRQIPTKKLRKVSDRPLPVMFIYSWQGKVDWQRHLQADTWGC